MKQGGGWFRDFLRECYRVSSGLIHQSAWKINSANFAMPEFSEVGVECGAEAIDPLEERVLSSLRHRTGQSDRPFFAFVFEDVPETVSVR
jgi:hypothetical protein